MREPRPATNHQWLVSIVWNLSRFNKGEPPRWLDMSHIMLSGLCQQ